MNIDTMKTGVIDVGGGLRGIYGAGVFDRCMDDGIFFDVGYGISAGSVNLISYLAEQRGRNYTFYTEYAFRKEYMGLGVFLRTHSFVNLDYAYGTLSRSDGEYPLDYPAIMRNPMEWRVVATDALTGKPKYFDKRDIAQDSYDIFKASSSLPVVCKPYVINGVPYYDGALSDPIPVKKALEDGCDKVVVILTRPKDFRRSAEKDERHAALLQRKYPNAAKSLRERAALYNDSLDLAEQYEKEGRVLIVAPDDICGMNTLTRDKAALQRMYEKGLHDGERIAAFFGK